MPIRVLLADDHNIVREGFRSLIDAESDMEVAGEAGDGREAVSLARRLKPDVIVMDVRMPELNGVEATRQIVTEMSSIRVIGLSMHLERHFVSEMLKAGASGYLLKDCPSQELITAIRTVVKDQIFLSPAVAGQVVEDYVVRPVAAGPSAFSQLSDREREVLQLIAEGRTMRDVAAQLHLSVNTVHTHRKHIMEKLDIHSVAGLTKYAIREGLTEL
jgi:DNA-binding NarL/FixJ family response regulator